MIRHLRHTQSWAADLRCRAWSLAVVATCLLAGRPACAQQPTAQPGRSPTADNHASQQLARAKRDRLMAIYVNDSAEYAIYRDASRKERV
jgi:hypothetical protein